MSSDAITASADMTFVDMIMDYAERNGQSWQQARDALIASGAYDALYDESMGLWASPGACLDFHEQLCAVGRHAH